MTKEELAAYEIKPISQIIPNWDGLPQIVKAVIESAFNLEWWRGYHAPRPVTMRHVRMGQPAPEGDTHIIRSSCPTVRDPRNPDYSRPGIFAEHNCWKCHDGAEPCIVGNPRQCEYPHARND